MTQKARLNLYDFLNNEQDYAPVTSPNLNRALSPHLKAYSTDEEDDEIGPWFDALPPKLSVTPKAVANSHANKQVIHLQTPKGDPKPSKLTTVRNYSSAAEKHQHKSPKITPKPIVENKPDRSGIFTNELLKERIAPSTRKVNNVKRVQTEHSQPKNDNKLILIVSNPENGTTKISRTDQKPQVIESPKLRHPSKRSSIMGEKSLDLKGTMNMRDSGEFEPSRSMTKIHSQTARVRGDSTDRRHSRRPSPADLGDMHEKPEMNPSFVIEGIQTKTSASKQQGFKLLKANIIARNRNVNQKPPVPVMPVMPVIPSVPTEEKLTIEKETIYSEGKRMIVTDRTGRPPQATNKTPLRKEMLYMSSSKEKEHEKEDIKTKLRVLRRINRPSYLQQNTVSPNDTKDMSVSLNRQKSVPRLSHHQEQQPVFVRHSEADALRPENNNNHQNNGYMLPLLKMQAMVKGPGPKPHLAMLNKNHDETATGTGSGTGTTTIEITKFSSYQSNERTRNSNTMNPPTSQHALGDSEKYILNTETCESNMGYDTSDQIMRTSPSPKNNNPTNTQVIFKFRKFTPTRTMDKNYKELSPDFYSKSYYNQGQRSQTGGEAKPPQTPGKNPLYSLTQKYKMSKESQPTEENSSNLTNLTNNKNTRIYRKPPTFEIQAAILQEKAIIRNARILKN